MYAHDTWGKCDCDILQVKRELVAGDDRFWTLTAQHRHAFCLMVTVYPSAMPPVSVRQEPKDEEWCQVGQERLGPSYFFISLVLGPLNSLVWVRTFLKVYGAWLLFFVSARTNKRHHHHNIIMMI